VISGRRLGLGISGRGLGLAIFAVGAPACLLATALDPDASRSAATQDWPAFVLVSGLLLIGVVASGAGLFELAGNQLARLPAGEVTRFVCAAALVGIVSALLNLDTAAAFLTPVLVYMTRRVGSSEAPLLYGCLLLTNAGSLLLPGSNLTNIIVAGHLHLVGSTFALHMAPAWAVALVVTALVVAVAHRKDLRKGGGSGRNKGRRNDLCNGGSKDLRKDGRSPPEQGASTRSATRTSREPSTSTITSVGSTLFAGAVVLATAILVVTLRNAAIPVVAIGVAAVGFELARRRLDLWSVADAIDPALLTGLLGVAIALGTLGRTWDVPARLLGHLGTFATAGFAAVSSIVFNNLPAASLLAARVPPHPYSMLVGLDLGPNLFVTGSLSALLWFRSARRAGADPSVRHTAAVGIVAAPLAIVAAVGVLSAGSLH
jgi:arsenical pump membrane protein